MVQLIHLDLLKCDRGLTPDPYQVRTDLALLASVSCYAIGIENS